MRKVVLQEFLSINAMAAGPGDSVEFIPASMAGDQSFGKRQLAFLDSVDTMLLGRVTYEMFANYWPNVTTGDDEPFADKLNALSRVVFSSTLDRAPWGAWGDATVIRGDAVDAVAKQRRQGGKDMVLWGSISLAQSLMKAGLIDVYELFFCPTILLKGRPLFLENIPPPGMTLANTRSFDRGAVLLSYEPAHVASAV